MIEGHHGYLEDYLEIEEPEYWLVDFYMWSGEYGQNFKHLFKCSEEFLTAKIHCYMKGYYGEDEQANRIGEGFFFYGDQVGLRYQGQKRIFEAEELIKELMI